MHLRNLAFFQEPVAISHLLHFYLWGGAPKSSLHLLEKVQSKAIRLISNPSLTNSLQSLSHLHLVADLSFSTAIFTDIALRKSGILFLIQ